MKRRRRIGLWAVVPFVAGVLRTTSLAGAADVATLAAATDACRGLAVVVNAGDAVDLVRLGKNPHFLVHGLYSDPGAVMPAREAIREQGLYGRVSAQSFDGTHLPYAENMITLLVVADSKWDIPEQEIARALSPRGRVFFPQDCAIALPGCSPAPVSSCPGWASMAKPWPDELDEWTHFLHGPDNNPVSTDTRVAQPRELRWVVGPRWARSHEEFASVSAVVSAHGRIFYIEDRGPHVSIRYPAQWVLVARDAFNGLPLWTRDIDPWIDHLRHFRSGPAHLARRLVARGERVFVTLGLDAPLTEIDAANGKTVRTFKGTESTEEIVCDGARLYLVVGTSERDRFGPGLFRRQEPEPTGTRYLVALDLDSGKELWRRDGSGDHYVLPLTLAAHTGCVFYQDTRGVVCLDAGTGGERWLARRATPRNRMAWSAPTLVVADDVVLSADRTVGREGPATTNVTWGVGGWNVPGVARKTGSKLIAYDATDGSELWSVACREGYNNPVELFVVDDTVWLHDLPSRGYDLRTGEVLSTVKSTGSRVSMVHHRCYRNKATERLLLTGRDGIEVVDFDKGWIGNNSWVRGGCQYGIMPANGLIYAPQDACACHIKARVYGFSALAGKHTVSRETAVRLVKGPAYGREYATAVEKAAATDWPTYRGNARRGGVAPSSVVHELAVRWRAPVGGRLTQAVRANGLMVVASIDRHTVVATDAKTGRERWHFIAGGRVDSAPTFFEGNVYFGCTDGCVYALDAVTGELAWQFRAAPEPRLVTSHGQLESAWPVHGAVLQQAGDIVFTAGRSTYLGGGLRYYRLDAGTGAVRADRTITHIDPATDRQTAREPWGKGFDSEGVTSDILSAEGDSVFIKHMRFDRNGAELDPVVPHLFAHTGFLGEEWFVRSFWQLGTWAGTGWGAWAASAGAFPSGRILCYDDARVFGYGRVAPKNAATGHRADRYHLFAASRGGEAETRPADAGGRRAAPRSAAGAVPPGVPPLDTTLDSVGAPDLSGLELEEKPRRQRNQPKRTVPRRNRSKRHTRTYRWSRPCDLIVRAMAATPEHLVIAGVPDAGQRSDGLLAWDNPGEALDALAGKHGAFLRILSADTGDRVGEIPLPAPPVFDGLSISRGMVFLALKNGDLVALAGSGSITAETP